MGKGSVTRAMQSENTYRQKARSLMQNVLSTPLFQPAQSGTGRDSVVRDHLVDDAFLVILSEQTASATVPDGSGLQLHDDVDKIALMPGGIVPVERAMEAGPFTISGQTTAESDAKLLIELSDWIPVKAAAPTDRPEIPPALSPGSGNSNGLNWLSEKVATRYPELKLTASSVEIDTKSPDVAERSDIAPGSQQIAQITGDTLPQMSSDAFDEPFGQKAPTEAAVGAGSTRPDAASTIAELTAVDPEVSDDMAGLRKTLQRTDLEIPSNSTPSPANTASEDRDPTRKAGPCPRGWRPRECAGAGSGRLRSPRAAWRSTRCPGPATRTTARTA